MKFKPNLNRVPFNFCGVDLFVKEWSVKQYTENMKALKEEEAKEDRDYARLAYLWSNGSLVDEAGEQVTIDNYEELKMTELNRLTKAVMEVNGFGNSEKKDS